MFDITRAMKREALLVLTGKCEERFLTLPILSNTITSQIVLQALTSVCKVNNLFSYCTMYLELLPSLIWFCSKQPNFHLCYVKSTLERVSNPVYCCINGIFHKLCHNSATIVIMPRWAEPRRHTVVIVCVCV